MHTQTQIIESPVILEDWPVAPYEPRKGDSEETLALIRARALIARRRGWTKGKSRTPQGAYCMIGAIETVTHKPHQLEVLLKDCLPRKSRYPDLVGSIATFNDASRTRKADVLAVYDRAIELSRKAYPR